MNRHLGPSDRIDVSFPFQLDHDRQVIDVGYIEHITQMIEQLLFTSPGERVNRPTFGCGLSGLVFAPARSELLTATEAQVHAALQRWLGEVIVVDAVDVTSSESQLRIDITYTVIGSNVTNRSSFQTPALP